MTSSRRTPSLSARDRTPSMKHMAPSSSARFGKRKPGDGNDDDDKDEGKAIPFFERRRREKNASSYRRFTVKVFMTFMIGAK